MGTSDPTQDESEFDPDDYDDVSEALQEAPAGYGAERVLDHFDPMVGDGALESDGESMSAPEPEYDRGRKDAVDAGAKIRAKLRRSTGTREHDELVIEGRGADADEAADDFEAALERAETGDYADRLRSVADDFNADTEGDDA